MRRVMLIGLDCVPPALAFERGASLMPNLASLMRRGAWGTLHSTMPPITVPAWTSMVSGRDPGELGLYGFRMRRARSYELSMVQSTDVRCERVWDVIARHGRRSSVLFVPPSYPPFPVQGELVSCFLTPDGQSPCTYPTPLRGELSARFGAYVPDVEVRSRAPEGLVNELVAMTRQHFAMARYVWQTREADFLMMVEIGPDRLHHASYQHLDAGHPKHDPSAPGVAEAERYYRELDRELGQLVALADADTAVLVASDHGARPLRSAFCINEWLIERGFLCLRERPGKAQPLKPSMIDFTRTRAWAEGGYYARVFLNVRGREPEGCVEPEQAEALCRELRQALLDVSGPRGERWLNRVEAPRELYRDVRGDAPDLLAVFDDLNVRALATVGGAGLHSDSDDRGADACNHDWRGIFVLAGAGVTVRGELPECSIYDVGATILGLFAVDKPADWLGQDRSRAS
ncbi:MAG: alkaline phosphatase family protein [Myxococcales bacterium]